MIKYILMFIFSTTWQSKSCEEQYLDKIVDNTTMLSYYLVVNIEEKGSGVKRMFIQRNDFFHALSFDSAFLKQSNKEDYVIKLILEKHVFEIKNQSLIKRYFFPLSTPDKRVDRLCNLGNEKFLNTIFDSSGLQKDTIYDLGYLVQKLFELRVPVMFYGDAVRLFLDRSYSCKCN